MSDEVRDYLNRIGKIPLLTPAEEIELGRIIQESNALAEKQVTKLTLSEKRLLKKGKRAQERMVSANLRLCFNIAKKYASNSNSLSILDLAQEGAVGLHKAAERFDPARGYKFSTFAYWWIRQSITRAITNKDNLIRLPTHRLQELARFKKALAENRSANPREIAKQIGVDYESIEITANTKVVSLDLPVNQKDEVPTPLMELIADEHGMDNIEDPILEALPYCIERLNKTDRSVIELRFFHNEQYKDIGKKLNISSDRASKISSAALEKLRRLINNEIILEQQELAV